MNSNSAWTQATFSAARADSVRSPAQSPKVPPPHQPTFKSAKDKISPDAAREAARNKILKLERALEVLSDSSGPSVDALKSELEKAPKISSDVPRDAWRNWKQSASPNQSCSRRPGSGCVIWRPPAVPKNRQFRFRQPPRWIQGPKCRVCSKWSASCRKSGMRWPRKSRVALWRDPECVNGSHQWPRWSHESSRSGWRTIS